MILTKDILFTHVAKTGGTSIEKILTNDFNDEVVHEVDYLELHEVLFVAKRDLPEDRFNSLFKFGFVRNPFDRELSNWFWHTRGNCHYDIDFDAWVKWRYSATDEYDQLHLSLIGEDYFYHKGFALTPQVGYFADGFGGNLANFIGRYETLQEDWAYVANKFGYKKELPHEYKTKRPKDYRPFYTTELIDIVTKFHKWDLGVFNYDFENGMLSKEIDFGKSTGFDFRLTGGYNYFYG